MSAGEFIELTLLDPLNYRVLYSLLKGQLHSLLTDLINLYECQPLIRILEKGAENKNTENILLAYCLTKRKNGQVTILIWG